MLRYQTLKTILRLLSFVKKLNDKKDLIEMRFFHLISYEIRTFIQKTRKKSNYIHISTPTTYFPLHMKKFRQPIEL